VTQLAVQRGVAESTGAASPGTMRARLVGVCKRIDGRVILRDVNLEVRGGSLVAVLGANGAGKSTLLRILATLTPPSGGRVELFDSPADRDRASLRARIGFIGHQPMLYRDLSAMENLEFFGRLHRVRDPIARAKELLELVGLADRAGNLVKSLSRGMVQRIAIARALMHAPDLLLADEPFTGLDATSVERIRRCFADVRGRGAAIVMTGHDGRQCLDLADHVVALCQGRVTLDRPARGLESKEILAALGEANAIGGPA
jgi:heme exporter protein A